LRRLQSAGGDQYATIASLVFRQAMGGCKLVWNDQKNILWYFMKEISSNGDLQTVDVVFPASPVFLHQNPFLLKKLIIPHLVFASQDPSLNGCNYNKAWAPHHLGQWPICDLTPEKQEDMPIEETANLLLMLAALDKVMDIKSYILKYYPLLKSYGDYLVMYLPDPEDQLCTDDFAGPAPHDSNLAAKGILGLEAFYLIAKRAGDPNAFMYDHFARTYAALWVYWSNPDYFDHYLLRYDQPGWSLKYNLVWQFILQTDIFPQHVFDTERAFYRSKTMTYGVPLDVRANYTKIDWESWVATFEPTIDGFTQAFSPLYKFAHQTTDRMPLSDLYYVDTARMQWFTARSVVGAFWLQAFLKKA